MIYLFLTLIIIGIVVLDQISKLIVVGNMALGESVTLIDGIFGLRYVHNTGAAFSIFSGHTEILSIFTIILIAAVSVYLFTRKNLKLDLFTVALAFIIGGGIGNIIDRMFRSGIFLKGYVVDMFEFLFVDFAVFNVADSFITVGAILVAIAVLMGHDAYWQTKKS